MTRRTALVTGGSRGLGAACSRALAADGCHVLIAYRDRTDDALATLRSVEQAGGTGETVACDLADPGAVSSLCQTMLDRDDPPAVLVNSAGVVSRTSLADTSDDALHHLWAVNVTAPFALVRGLVPAMAKSGGAVVNVASVLASAGGVDRAAYAASKAAVVGMTRSLATELAPEVRVNAVLPGVFETEMNAALTADPVRRGDFEARIPLRRLGSPDELGAVVAFLAGPGASYVTGVAWEVDGGALARTSLASGDARA